MAFDAETFVRECRAAGVEDDPVAAVREVVAAAIADGASIDAALGTERKREREPETLFSSSDLTVQRIVWPPGAFSSRHDHRMWAVIGVYAGQEINHLYARSAGGLKECDRRRVGERQVLVLRSDVIHSVENGRRERTAGLHVYGGDIVNLERSAWGPDGREVSFQKNVAARMPMFNAMRDLAAEQGMRVDDDSRYVALMALRATCERERRYPSSSEARRIIADAWNLPH